VTSIASRAIAAAGPEGRNACRSLRAAVPLTRAVGDPPGQACEPAPSRRHGRQDHDGGEELKEQAEDDPACRGAGAGDECQTRRPRPAPAR
jgi:hypothetical protein